MDMGDHSHSTQDGCGQGAQNLESTSQHESHPVKKRRIQMNDAQCLSHAMTSDGAKPLTHPSAQTLTKKPKWDVNRGLYPRQRNWPCASPKCPPHTPGGQSVGKTQNSTVTDSSLSSKYYPWGTSGSPRKPTPSSSQKIPSFKSATATSSNASPMKQTSLHSFFSVSPKKSATSSRNLETRDQPSCSSSVIKDFENDNTLTTDDFDVILIEAESPKKKTQSFKQEKLGAPHHSTSCANEQKQSTGLEDFEQDDSITADDFDAVLFLSQSPAKETNASRQTHDSDEVVFVSESTAKSATGFQQKTSNPSLDGPGPSQGPCTFGLLGEGFQTPDTDSAEDGSFRDYFGLLPDEVVENILGQLPILDIYLTASNVCKRWNAIISRPHFVQWKKRYYQLKLLQGTDQMNAVQKPLEESGELTERNCLVQLIKYMGTVRVHSVGATECLKHHQKFRAACQVLKARAPEVFSNEEPHSWSLVAAMVVLSETAQEVCQILRSLLLTKEPVQRLDLSECLYCIAAALFLFQKKFNINRGPHYRVFYALHKLESSGPGDNDELSDTAKQSSSGQQSLLRYGQRKGIDLTPEQMRIINHNLQPTDCIKIIAFAGTGKTTTLIRFAQLRPHLNFLYIAFNKSVQEEARKKFPSNVESRTLHSLAYKAVGFKYRAKMGSALKPYFIMSVLPKPDEKKIHHMTLAKHVCTTINNFLASAEGFISTAHVPQMDNTSRQVIEHDVRMIIADAAEKVFRALCDLRNIETRITHDIYLKLYEMQHPVLDGYDCLLIDEAQDLTPAQQSILLRQNCAKILVGDPHQQIYSFRGATNAMAQVTATRIYRLTESFRFGPEIAYVANCLLESLKNETKRSIIGTGPPGHVLGQSIGQVATICRSNATLFTQAANIVTQNENAKIEFAGGVQGYRFDRILDIYYLSLPPHQRKNYKMKDKFVSRFKSLTALDNYAKSTEDADLQSAIKIVLLYNNRIPNLVEKIKKSVVRSNGAMLLSTAHKSKGLEFDTVQLTDDYADSLVGLLREIPEDEMNILYVAVTRAKKCLLLNSTLLGFLKKVKEKFDYPVLAEVRGKDGPQRCQECGELRENTDELLWLQRKRLVHAFKRKVEEAGIVCSQCVEAPGFQELYGKPETDDEEDEAEPDMAPFLVVNIPVIVDLLGL
ncbi:F-box DNA helicase 1-like [Diadema antillarum]|uniref:F-box DNA helicase 1-like n=1 Tax=Diadema antillarum TaxID=105358 RepID=UPI003A889C9C